MVAQYNYLATDLVTGTVLGELPINGVSLDCQLNSAGNMTAGANLDDPRIDSNEFLSRTTPGKTAMWVYRENQIVWGGVILTRTYQSQGKAVTITGQTFECYPNRRFPRSVIGTAVQSLSMGQCAMIDYLWQQLQSIANGSIGVIPVAVFPSVDPTTALTINGYDLSTSYGDLIKSITQLVGSPDWTVAWTEDGNGLPLKQLVVGTPIGNPVGMTDLVVDTPGSISNYTLTENSSSGNNEWWAVGDGVADAAIVGNAADSNSFASGYPLWEGVNNYSGVTQQVTINAHAASDLSAFPVPLVTHSLELIGDAWPPFGSYGMGDYVEVNAIDARFPDGFTFKVRAIGWSINPPDSQGVETINLILDEATGGG